MAYFTDDLGVKDPRHADDNDFHQTKKVLLTCSTSIVSQHASAVCSGAQHFRFLRLLLIIA